MTRLAIMRTLKTSARRKATYSARGLTKAKNILTTDAHGSARMRKFIGNNFLPAIKIFGNGDMLSFEK
jgi:hypothetical protein